MILLNAASISVLYVDVLIDYFFVDFLSEIRSSKKRNH